jgi:hypothetical protein
VVSAWGDTAEDYLQRIAIALESIAESLAPVVAPGPGDRGAES